METEKELNSKIMAHTLQIREKYPELSEHLDEMPLTIPNETNPQVTVKKLKEYYGSLNLLLKKHP